MGISSSYGSRQSAVSSLAVCYSSLLAAPIAGNGDEMDMMDTIDAHSQTSATNASGNSQQPTAVRWQ